MLSGAAVAVAHKGLVEETIAEGPQYTMRSSKPSAYLTAYLRIAQEYRRFRKVLAEEERERATAAAKAEEMEEQQTGGLATLMLPVLEKAGDLLGCSYEQRRRAKQHRREVEQGKISPDPEDLQEDWHKRAFPKKE